MPDPILPAAHPQPTALAPAGAPASDAARLPRHLKPADHPERRALSDEIHARPTARIRHPALVTHIAVLNAGIAPEVEHAHLRALFDALGAPCHFDEPHFMRANTEAFTLKWERHGEFSRYSITQPLDQDAVWGADEPDLTSLVRAPADWLRAIPGQTMAAIHVVLLRADPAMSPEEEVEHARAFLGTPRLCGSWLRGGSSRARAYANFKIRADGFTRFLVMGERLQEGKAGRITAGLLEMETYRVMALLGFAPARRLGGRLAAGEHELAELTQSIHRPERDDVGLLEELMRLAGDNEMILADHTTRFSASKAYYGIVQQRLTDLFDEPVTHLMGIGPFVQRRLMPAMATVDATVQRMNQLSERVSRTSALLRTRVEIQTELQNQDLLRSIGRGQRMQLHLQQTVEGLSIAAITYYASSLVHHLAEAAHGMGLHVSPELVTGFSIPVIAAAIWWTTRRLTGHVEHAGD
ncbi:DUF3422 family protein [Derxia gummosa]|uniref:DUF3422 family protein n=1 Tax=Derxia gummosa DSM 723 TaxID=1121388 RepID=A0A8B6XCV3_9BURK|nr:DUF3422 domain-containing protein [Derxia gummosa]